MSSNIVHLPHGFLFGLKLAIKTCLREIVIYIYKQVKSFLYYLTHLNLICVL